ncbi:hypothetical protein [Kutzneria sp. NPDC052558]|uniref:hypothetical protein n=1 Tax=Kutzneria sp. NPDC052558 TaxID=3364121 RepID=UPI0037C945CA
MIRKTVASAAALVAAGAPVHRRRLHGRSIVIDGDVRGLGTPGFDKLTASVRLG